MLRLSVGAHYQHLLSEATTAQEGWSTLKRHFDRDTHGTRVQLQRELITIRQTERESVEQYFNRFTSLRRKLTDMGDGITELQAKRYLVDGLSNRYRTAGANLIDSVVNRDDATVTDLMLRLFDIERYTRHLKAAYAGMAARAGTGPRRQGVTFEAHHFWLCD